MGPKKSYTEKIFGPQKILVLKFFGPKKYFGPKKKHLIRKRKQSQLLDYLTCVGKKILDKKNFKSGKIFSSKKNSCPKKSLVSEKILESEKVFGSEKNSCPKNFWLEICWSKKFFVKKSFCRKFFLVK